MTTATTCPGCPVVTLSDEIDAGGFTVNDALLLLLKAVPVDVVPDIETW